MTEQFTIDGEALASISASIDLQAGSVPMSAALDLGGCGSAAVASAAQSFSMWATIAGIVAHDGVVLAASDALTAARTFGDWDSAAAHNSRMTAV